MDSVPGWVLGIVGTVVGSVLTFFAVGYFQGVNEAAAIANATQIRQIAGDVYEEKSKLPDGKTQGQVISENTKAIIELTTTMRLLGNSIEPIIRDRDTDE